MKRNRKPSKISEKYTLTIDYLMKNQLDILFLQEAGTVDWH